MSVDKWLLTDPSLCFYSQSKRWSPGLYSMTEAPSSQPNTWFRRRWRFPLFWHIRSPKCISVSSQNSPLHLNWINAAYLFLTQVTQTETEKLKHWKIWSTWCQMFASLFSSSVAVKGHRSSPGDLRAMKVSPEGNLRDHLVHSSSLQLLAGQVLNHTEPQVLSCKLRSSIVTHCPGNTWGRKNQQVIADLENVPHKSREPCPTPCPIETLLPCPVTRFSLSFLSTPGILWPALKILPSHNPIYSFTEGPPCVRHWARNQGYELSKMRPLPSYSLASTAGNRRPAAFCFVFTEPSLLQTEAWEKLSFYL